MGFDLAHAVASVIAAFLASLVEFVEVPAVGGVRAWRGAISGSATALVVLLVLVAILGNALTRIPLQVIQLAVGGLLLPAGLRWLRNAILRAAGSIIAIGAGSSTLLVPAGLGALAGLFVVVALGVALHHPLASIPENTLKFAVGVLFSAFGTFWIGEAFSLRWPGVGLVDSGSDRGLPSHCRCDCVAGAGACGTRFSDGYSLGEKACPG